MANSNVAPSTAFEDARCALAWSIFNRAGRRVANNEWITTKPTDFEAEAAAWTQTLRKAEQLLTQMGHQMPGDQITTAEATALLGEVLLSSVRFLFDRILVRRPPLNGRGGIVCPQAGEA